MALLTLAEVRRQLKMEPDYIDEDDYLSLLLAAVETHIANACDGTLIATQADLDAMITADEANGTSDTPTNPIVIEGKSNLKLAALLLIGHWYEHREAVVVGTISSNVPLTFEALINPYRDRGVG